MTAHKDFLGRTLEIGDRVIMMAHHSREFKLAQVVKFTPKKVKVAWADYDWATYTTEGSLKKNSKICLLKLACVTITSAIQNKACKVTNMCRVM